MNTIEKSLPKPDFYDDEYGFRIWILGSLLTEMKNKQGKSDEYIQRVLVEMAYQTPSGSYWFELEEITISLVSRLCQIVLDGEQVDGFPEYPVSVGGEDIVNIVEIDPKGKVFLIWDVYGKFV